MRVTLRRGRLAATALVIAVACGARTELRAGRADAGAGGEGGESGEAGAPAEAGTGGEAGEGGTPICFTTQDCPAQGGCTPRVCVEGVCVELPPLDCDDADPCTTDSCDPASGACVHDASIDADLDGHIAVGTDTSAMCGDDCDDANPDVYPGASEICDGEDNDCDGSIDEGTTLSYENFEPVRVSADDVKSAGRAGLARSDGALAVTYTGLSGTRWRSYLGAIDTSGNPLSTPALVTEVNADTYAGLLAFSGTVFGTAWSDARQDGNYEIYFSRFDPAGEKISADLRLSDAPDFSLHPVLQSHDEGFVIVWDDRREEDLGGAPAQIYGRSVDENDAPGEEIVLTPADELAEFPWVALGESRIGLVYTVLLDSDAIIARFRTFDLSLGDASASIDLGGTDVQEPSVVYVAGQFFVAWNRYDVGPGNVIEMAIVSETGNLVRSATPVVTSSGHARTHSLVALGDRLFLVWGDDRDGNFELYGETLDVNLSVTAAPQRITVNDADSLYPLLTVLPGGGVGILFDDWREGRRQPFFTRVECGADQP